MPTMTRSERERRKLTRDAIALAAKREGNPLDVPFGKPPEPISGWQRAFDSLEAAREHGRRLGLANRGRRKKPTERVLGALEGKLTKLLKSAQRLT